MREWRFCKRVSRAAANGKRPSEHRFRRPFYFRQRGMCRPAMHGFQRSDRIGKVCS
ncbi:hypothetical protein HMPREF9120_00074 [Neisseria sp. oral taxon 020 str. F0370]|nr:hypothetical protein HMPREF9120_00074 [Neisseria sp. oral taxon 020 str. F0370]